MQIQNQSQTMDPAQLAATSSNSQAPATPTNIDGLANEDTFLQLLVAQIKNQDPLNPTDSVQFLSQLAQFSQLEQLIGIRSELKPATAPTNSTDPNGGTTSPTKTTN
jgi:flagellar basal-body rod modification protein FlgD